MNSENKSNSESPVLILKLTNKLDLGLGEKVIVLSNLSIYYTWKKQKAHTITTKLKYLHQLGAINLNCQMDHIVYKIFKIILSIFIKDMGKM